MQASSPPVITPNRSQSNPDDMIILPRPIQSVDMDLHDVSGTSTGQTLPRERRAPPGTHFCPTIWWVYPHSATIFILHPILSTFSSTFVRNIPTFDHSSTLKRRPQTSVTAADLVWVCAPPRTIRKWLRRLAFWILRTRTQDPCSCSCRPGVGLRPAANHPQMVTTPGVLNPADPQDPCSCCLIFRTKVDEKVDNIGWRIYIVAECGYTHQIVGQKWVPSGALLSRGRVWPVHVPETSCKSMPTL